MAKRGQLSLHNRWRRRRIELSQSHSPATKTRVLPIINMGYGSGRHLPLQGLFRAKTHKQIDFYLGEVYQGNYPQEYALLKQTVKEYGGALKTFKNHSKVLSGYGDKFYFGVEGSANMNKNPRTENACITIGEEIYHFYRDYYDGIQGFKEN